MADFNVTARNGNMINVPDFAKLNIDGLDIIGDQTTDWNEPIQKNFLAIDKKVMNLENKVLADVPVGAIFTDTVYSKPVSEPISYIVGLQTELDKKLEEHQDISGKAEKSEVPTKVSDLANDAGYIDVQLSKSDILEMGFRDTDFDTQLSEAQIAAMGFTKDVNTDTIYDDTAILDAIDLEKFRIDGILDASGADADTFAEIVALVNSVDTANDEVFAGYVLSNNSRSTSIETVLSETYRKSEVDAKLDIQKEASAISVTPNGDLSEGSVQSALEELHTVVNEMSELGAVGGGTDRVFYENDNVINNSYTITSGKNALSTGPLTIVDGVEITVPVDSAWVII